MGNLRGGLARDVHQIVQKYEDEMSDGGARKLPVTTVSSIYDYIQRSNSSLRRHKKRPLEEVIERALDKRREEAKDDRDSDDELEQQLRGRKECAPDERTGSLINKQLTKHWTFNKAQGSPLSAAAGSASDAVDVHPPPRASATPGPAGDGDRHPTGEARPKRRRKDRRGSSSAAPAPAVDRIPSPGGRNLDDMAGMEAVVQRLMGPLYVPLECADVLARLGHTPADGVLLHGPSGCGKTALAHALAAEFGVAFIPVSTQSLVSGTSGESEKNIRNVFDEAMRVAPCIIFLDELDTIAGKKDSVLKAMDGRIIAEISSGMDRLGQRPARPRTTSDDDESPARGNVVVLAATNKPDNIDPTIRRRFGVEVEIGMPNEAVREEILRTMTRDRALADDVDFAALARLTPGFVGSDLKHVVAAATYNCALSMVEARNTQLLAQTDVLYRPSSSRPLRLANAARALSTGPKNAIDMADFTAAVAAVQPAAKREGFSAVPDTTWAHVGALAGVRRKLEMCIIGPIKHPQRFAAVGIRPAAGILLWGPPGCGKTLVAKAVANESKASFVSIKGPELLNKYVGESERAVRGLFARARSMAPCILFFDEMDALVPTRDVALTDSGSRVVNAFLTELDGTGDRSGVYVVGATNRPDCIDPAIRRPGRLGTSVFVGLPSAEERVDILRTIYHNTIAAGQEGMDGKLRAIALDRRCNGFSGADLGNLMQAAAQASLERRYLGKDITGEANEDGTDEIMPGDWEKALEEVKPSVKKDDGRYDPRLY